MKIKYSTPFFLFFTLNLTDLSATIYQKKMPDGSITFQDIAPDQDAPAMALPPLPITPTPSQTGIPTPPPSALSLNTEPVLLHHPVFEIQSPADHAHFFNDTSSILIQIEVKPDLTEEETLVLWIDQKKIDLKNNLSYNLSSLDPGTHTLKAQIFNAKDNQLIQESKSIEFYKHHPHLPSH